MSLKCANCLNMKVTYVKLGGHSYKTHKAECKYNHHKKAITPELPMPRGWFQLWLVKDVTPPNPHHCADYESMGEEVESFLLSLPVTKDDYRQIWREL